MRPKCPAPSYQEAIVAWLPISPFVSWPILCLAYLLVVVLILSENFVAAAPPQALKRQIALFGLSYIVIVYEIIGIIGGQRSSKRLEASLPGLLGPHYQDPPSTWDQYCLLGNRAILPWEERLHRVWRCKPILLIAAAGGVMGGAMGYIFFSIATGRQSAGIALALWLGLGGFWGAPALYHLAAASWFVRRLSSQVDKHVFINPKSAGVNSITRLAFEYLALFSGAAFLWALVSVIAVGLTGTFVIVVSVLSVFVVVGFFVPQLSIRSAMVKRRREMLDGILTSIRSNGNVLVSTPAPDV